MIVSCAALLPILVFFVLTTPGFAELLGQNEAARGRFLRQVFTNGVPVISLVNYSSFFLLAVLVTKGAPRLAFLLLLIDLPLRVVTFFFLHAVIYVMSAHWFGSFGGDRLQALQVVGPTLAGAAAFENISGVYLYATLVGALPLYALALQYLFGCRLPFGRNLQTAIIMLASLGLFIISALMTTGVAFAIMNLST